MGAPFGAAFSAVKPRDHGIYPPTTLVEIENTHNRAGGVVFAQDEAERICAAAREHAIIVSIGISVVETLGDGLLGLVLWLGPVIAYDYYSGLHRAWGPSLRGGTHPAG